MATAEILINGVAPSGPVLLTPSSTITVSLVGTAVNASAEFKGASEAGVTYPTLTLTNRGVWSFTSPAAPSHGFGLGLRLEVQNGDAVSSTLVFVGSTALLVAGETTERGEAGWTYQLNAVATNPLSLSVDQAATTVAAVPLSTDASTAVLPVVLTGLAATKTYSAIVGARVAINTIGTPANAGYIDIVTFCTIATNGSAVATVTLPVLVVPDTSKLPSAIAAATATVSASTGGFTLYATRVASTNMRVTLGQAWIRDVIEVA